MDKKHQNESQDMSAWREDRKLVLHVLSENTAAIKELTAKIDTRSESEIIARHKQATRITRMEARSGFFGVIGGFMGFISLVGLEWIRGLVTKS